MTATLKELGDTLSTAQKQLAELVAAENPTPTPIPDKPVGSLPLDTTIRGAFEKTLILPYSSLILAGQVVIQLATGQAVNVISTGRRDNGDLTAVIDQSIGDPSKVIGKAATVRDRYAKPVTVPVEETPVVTLPPVVADPGETPPRRRYCPAWRCSRTSLTSASTWRRTRMRTRCCLVKPVPTSNGRVVQTSVSTYATWASA